MCLRLLCAFRQAGQWAPICLVIVSILLYSFRFICSEVVTAMPVNGGVYNHFLNTTRKTLGAFGACLSMLDYLGTYVAAQTCYLVAVCLSMDFSLTRAAPLSGESDVK